MRDVNGREAEITGKQSRVHATSGVRKSAKQSNVNWIILTDIPPTLGHVSPGERCVGCVMKRGRSR